MNATIMIAVVAALALTQPATGAAQDAAKKEPAAFAAPAAPVTLRKPGFLFLELYTQHVRDYVSFFERAAGFKAVRVEEQWAELVSERGEVMLNAVAEHGAMPEPFRGKLTGAGQGVGVEIGIVVADLDAAFAETARADKQKWKITTGIVRRPWGARDFRVETQDGYYLRFTEPR